jgi:hypothetical protein
MQPSTSSTSVDTAWRYNGSQADFRTFMQRLESNESFRHLLHRPPARNGNPNVTPEEIARDLVTNTELFTTIWDLLTPTMFAIFDDWAWNAPVRNDGHGAYQRIRTEALAPNNPVDQWIATRAAA